MRVSANPEFGTMCHLSAAAAMSSTRFSVVRAPMLRRDSSLEPRSNMIASRPLSTSRHVMGEIKSLTRPADIEQHAPLQPPHMISTQVQFQDAISM
ncbi:Hypothetical predicted protein [Cloeon dipterum]|uniref:Uncharacterized protein n=1 Tax=Cloeon dipterum TaxID=197152 RepID=A0A8S1DTS8_9INSE|nr:Hypothetical predicted protein [Cloeon dipterum]